MSNITITFPDGNKKEFAKGINAIDIAMSLSEGLARAVVGAKINDEIVDATQPIKSDASIELLKFENPEGLEIFRHTSSHILAQAVLILFPNTKLTIGPVVKDGFYYDFDTENPFTEQDLEKIELEMKKIVKENLPIERVELTKSEALKTFKDNPYKIELINDLKDNTITAYKQGNFIDLCKGPHLPSTGKVKALKLMKFSAAYWKGKSENKSLQRIYGISFSDKKELNKYLTLLKEAKKRDHRIIGKNLNLYSFQDEAPGMPFFHDKGSHIYNKLGEFMLNAMIKRDYEINKTPMILNKDLWLQSGHWDHYKDNMYFTKIDSNVENFAIKPMNCPGNILIYKANYHSYKELPIRAGEFGVVHRHELSGVLSGLFRVRCFTQDDAHVFCTEEQLKSEIKELLDFIDYIYKAFGFEYKMELSTRPDKSLGQGNDDLWELAENTLKETLEENNKEYKLNPGDGAFYGPKIDFHLTDAIGRVWQCGTIQLDFQMPEKFDLTYEGSDGQKHRPVMLHRAIYGSFERFLGILVEHYAGKFPLWISPNQITILPIADRHIDFAKKLRNEFIDFGLRANIDSRSESTKKKVREAQLQQYNYILVVGDKEIEEGTVSIRTRSNELIGSKKVEHFIQMLQEEISEKR